MITMYYFKWKYGKDFVSPKFKISRKEWSKCFVHLWGNKFPAQTTTKNKRIYNNIIFKLNWLISVFGILLYVVYYNSSIFFLFFFCRGECWVDGCIVLWSKTWCDYLILLFFYISFLCFRLQLSQHCLLLMW